MCCRAKNQLLSRFCGRHFRGSSAFKPMHSWLQAVFPLSCLHPTRHTTPSRRSQGSQMQPEAQAPVSWVVSARGSSPFGQPPLKFYCFEAQVPPDLELKKGSNAPITPSPAAPGRVYFTLSCPDLVPTPDEEALRPQMPRLGTARRAC